MSKIPPPPLPDPQEAARRNPFARARAAAPEPAAATLESDTGHSGDSAHSGTGNAAGEGTESGGTSKRTKRMARSKDKLVSLPLDLAERLESVVAYTHPFTGNSEHSVFIREAIAEKCARMEAQFNNGKRWPPIPPKQQSKQRTN